MQEIFDRLRKKPSASENKEYMDIKIDDVFEGVQFIQAVTNKFYPKNTVNVQLTYNGRKNFDDDRYLANTKDEIRKTLNSLERMGTDTIGIQVTIKTAGGTVVFNNSVGKASDGYGGTNKPFAMYYFGEMLVKVGKSFIKRTKSEDKKKAVYDDVAKIKENLPHYFEKPEETMQDKAVKFAKNLAERLGLGL